MIHNLFGVSLPIVQGGMIWCSGARLAAAVSNAGGLGLLGSGSMYPEELKLAIEDTKRLTSKPFGVNLPLLYPLVDQHIQTIIDSQIPVVFTSAGSPKKYTSLFKSHGIQVVHVVSSSEFAKKSEDAGVDAVVAEGFEAGGHNGREETTTMCLIPAVVDAVKIPVIAAGGIGCGRTMSAAIALGASGVQVGSRFAMTLESDAHGLFKEMVLAAKEGDTKLTLKEITPVRLLNTPFYKSVIEAYDNGATLDELRELLGRGRAKKGMREGNITDGEFEIGQISGRINSIESAENVIMQMVQEFNAVNSKLGNISF
ncbi:MAG: NAD(P)H-dependent flavin oxidoreductase [Bacteroidota bacterium]|jgi:enoyl-[acyl-carrier protein] reductase II